MPIKNNVTRMLDAKGIEYVAHELPNRKVGALEAGTHIGVDPEIVFKTIVATVMDTGKTVLALVPGTQEAAPKAIAKAVNAKKVVVTTQAQAEKLTGLQAGGISPLDLFNRGFQVVIDKSALSHEKIIISGGQWGINIEMSPQDIISLTNAQSAKITN